MLLLRIYIIFCSIFIPNICGQRWYSASISDTQYESENSTKLSESKPYHFPDRHRNIPNEKSENTNAAKDNLFLSSKDNAIDLFITNAVPNVIRSKTSQSVSPKYEMSRILTDNGKTSQKVVENYPKQSTPSQTGSTTDNILSYNNSIKNTNTPLKRPKKKRRFPIIRPRNKKQLDNNIRRNKTSKFLEIFQVVEFDHVFCTSSSGLEGKCLHEYECQSSGGAPMGNCADGYGTCCVTQVSCGDQTNTPLSWFTNPGYPSPSSSRLSCAISLDKAAADITQIRLDFTFFELQPPRYGTCEQDQFVVSGQNINSYVPILCGVNNGQHLYIEVGDIAGPIYLSIQTITEESRLFAVKMTQLTTFDTLAAPPGCLQYFTEAHGIFESFNYQDTSTIAIARNPSYLNNLNYAICIKRGPEMCTISYANNGDMQITNYDSDGLPVIPPGQAGVEIFNCPSDWLLAAAARLCGERFNDGSVLQDFSLNAPVTDASAGPIVVWFKSDGAVTGRGFRLEYQQNSCINPS